MCFLLISLNIYKNYLPFYLKWHHNRVHLQNYPCLIFFLINVDFQASLRVSQLISRALKLTII
jgi:hypothetical protein